MEIYIWINSESENIFLLSQREIRANSSLAVEPTKLFRDSIIGISVGKWKIHAPHVLSRGKARGSKKIPGCRESNQTHLIWEKPALKNLFQHVRLFKQ